MIEFLNDYPFEYAAREKKMRKWQDDTIKAILELREKGWTYRNIAVQYGVTSQRIRKVVEDYYDRQTKSANNLGLSTRVIHCLRRANIGINPYDIALNMVVLMNINGLGKRSLEEILQVLQSFNLLNP